METQTDTRTSALANGRNAAPGVQPPAAPLRLGFAGMGSAGVFALLAGLLAGIVLYLPWDTVWNHALKRIAANKSPVRIVWQSLDRATPLGFRINGLTVEAPGWSVSPRVQWLDVRLGVSPLLTLRADTGGRVLRLVFLDTGDFDVEGAANLACLGRRDILGSVDLRGQGRFLRGKDELEKGFIDLRGKALQLPGGLWLGDAALSLEYKDSALRIRSFSLREPVQVRAEGTAAVRPGALLSSPYTVAGEILRGRDSLTFTSQGVLGDFLGDTALPE
ncbi:MAG: hypothetical protein Q8O35_13460 [Humidesulfovibrio sp.]|uniref:hypothetical protein n=1 Tax=Humidesulfovibrio sp. TaxID=2910988 RepID=UPI002735874E|nr:hypothetical protein [Humidesulfovibrio sp.]MDP2849178.1 hypothetical protein [Humidesulfovibrio sp.]